MSQIPNIGAHIALFGVGEFQGSIRQVIYAINSIVSSVERMAAQQNKSGAEAAANTEKYAALQARATEVSARQMVAAREAAAAGMEAANARILANDAKMAAAMAKQDVQTAAGNVLGATPRSPERNAAKIELTGARGAVPVLAAEAAQLELNAKAAEKTYNAYQRGANAAAKESQNLEKQLAELSTTTAAVGQGFSVMHTIAIAAIVGIIAAIAILIGAIISASVGAIKIGADYAQGMNTVQTLTGAANSQMSELNDTILQIGTTTTASMGAAADATAELAKAGVSIQDAMAGALESVVHLSEASAGELKLADAAKAVANGMTAFNLHGTESVKVADAITAVAQSTTATYSDLAHSLQQVGTVANNLNYTIGQTYTAIGLLSLNAIKGSDAGTALRTMFQHLENPSKQATKLLNDYKVSLYDSAGAARPLRDVVINLEQAFGKQAIASGKLTQARRDDALATIFGTDGMRAALALINSGVEGYDRLTEAQTRLTAADVASKMILPLNVQLEILGNNINAIAVQFGGAFEPALQKVTAGVLGLVNGIALNTTALTLMGNAVSALVTGEGFDALYTQITNLFGADLGNKIIEFVNLFRNIGDAIGEFVAPALSALGEAISTAFADTGNIDAFAAVMQSVAEGFRLFMMIVGAVITTVANLVNAFGQLPGEVRNVAAAFLSLFTPLGSLLLGFGVIPQVVKAVIDALIALPPLGSAVGQAFSALGSAVQAGLAGIGGIFDAIGTQAHAFASAIGEAIGAAIAALEPFAPALLIVVAPMLTVIAVSVLVAEAISTMVQAIAAKLEEMRPAIEQAAAAFAKLPEEAGQSFERFGTMLSNLSKFIGEVFSGIGEFVQGMWSGLWEWVVNFFAAAVNLLGEAANMLGTGFVTLFTALGTAINSIWGITWENTVETVKNAVKALVQNVGVLGNSIVSAFSSAGNAIGNVWHNIWAGIQSILVSALNALASKLNGFFEALKASPVGQFVEGAIGGFQQLGESAIASMGALGDKVDEVQASIQGSLADLRSSITATSGAFEGIKFSVPTLGGGGGGAGLGGPPPAAGGGGGATPSTGAGQYPDESGADKAAKKAAQDAAEALKRLEELYQDTSRKLVNLANDTTEKIAEAWQKHEDAMLIAARENGEKIQKIYEKRDSDLEKENTSYNNKYIREDLKQALADEIELNRTARARINEDIETAHGRELEATRRARQQQRDLLEQAYQYEQEDQERAIKRGVESIDRGVQRANAAVQEGLQEQQQMQSRSLSAMFDMMNAARQDQYSAEDAARSRQRDQAKASAQYARDLAKATDPQQRLEIQQRYAEQQQELSVRMAEAQQDLQIQQARKAQDLAAKQAQQGAEDALKRQQQAQSKGLSYSQEDADVKRRQGQEDADAKRQRDNAAKTRDYRLGLDADERKTREGEDDKETTRKRGLEDTEKGIRKDEDKQVRDQQRGFDLEDHLLKIQQITDEFNTSLSLQQREYEEKQQAIDKSLNDELFKIQETYDKARRAIVQAWEDAWDELITKSPGIITQLDALFGSFMDNVAATDAMVTKLISDLQAAIALQNNVSGTGASGDAGTTAENGTPQSGPDAGEPDYAHGGIVKGPWGSAQNITAHGGEVYMGLQNQMARYMPTAVALANMGNPTPVISNTSNVTNVNYSVNASYANTQSPASVAMDLQALGMMVRR